ncbi:MAG: pro-sigmaK processing inhibitor BofA family protein [Nanoarchaeota archaeon]|nr:pro-sigmaK processing inhibitor BofA family protein [Nanoarchaeota archaeon]MBU1320898.1 pro-sigmaK processing inhibitor BofA family protein [Nanoarchaeota archaeon]MBU1597578.1 pro-sigmaK processing inhibitor BofA family protein [Nanoarchaeota archaeon]MBU2441507.1 pro-sigmaK processing inhibitor BofA family protein [Nanoarchaeota archaeon]
MLKELIALVIVVILLLLFFKLVKTVIILIINSVLGLFALFGFNFLFNETIAINVWSVLITAVGGLIGFIIVTAAHFLGWAF